MYSQFGDLLDACKVFDEISHPCIVEYNAMLDAYAKNGDVGSACFLLKSMPKRDVVSWTSVINGFAKNGFFGEAIRLFREMMLRDDAKFGFVKPNEATYVSVLSSCANLDERGVLCMGKQIHGWLLELQPHHCGQYVALSSIHAGVNRWGVAADIRTTMTEARIRKVPACSLIDCI
ncbi:hypothetical protein SADUNF_SadunfUnG0007000 [Salix dunnii]|uniref:Pentatricopeptide repeat-containing protein n=1 Tax=Salix dunnii TaxID=1413687 RepID=A0A835MKB4_9ROSI|nr:hypothetical protein SADUNF_SadunfUnG0007000 [Salix dunnii]